MTTQRWTAAAIALLVAAWLAMMIVGTGPADHWLLTHLYAADRPLLRASMIVVTQFGNWQPVIIGTLVGVSWLLWFGHRRSALLLLGVTLTGRTLIEAQKYGVHRLRPSEFDHLVTVHSLSFPSAHAGNSMLLFLSLALIAAPPRWRWWAVPAALAGALLVGLSRPMLGVHWPSDVVGGWSFGAAWVLLMVALAERWPARRLTTRSSEE